MPPLLAEPNGKVLRNLDNSDLLKTEIAYNTPIFTSVTKSRQWPKIMVHGENHGDREFVIFLQPYK